MKASEKYFHTGDLHHRKILVSKFYILLFNIFYLMVLVKYLSIYLIFMTNYFLSWFTDNLHLF